MTGKEAAAIFIVFCIVFAGIAYYFDPTLGGLLKIREEEEEIEGWLGGTFTLTVAGRNSLDASSSLTAGTDFTAAFYGYRGATWVFLGSEDGTGTNIESISDDAGYVWLLIEEISTKYYYADVPTSKSKNTFITEHKWVDADGDLENEFLYKCSLVGIPEPASGYPSRTYYPYFLAESGQGTAANALQWDTQPSDANIGTSATTSYISWKTKLTAEKRAVGIYKIEIIVNTTDTTLFTIDRVNIPGVGYLDGSLFTEDVRSTDTKYQYVVGSDFSNVVYWKVPAGTNNEFDNTVAVKFPAGSAELQFTLYIYQWLYDRSSVSDNDAVVLTQA